MSKSPMWLSVSDDMASDGTGIPDNDAVEYVYTPSDDEHSKPSDMLSIVLHLTVHLTTMMMMMRLAA
ncbi:hypothetical protein PI124_g21954 [Phytophthora idaei]|nr:hypothetical protein PI125_g23914 [Phytophthora idaei]KAG3127510.1 hypothetical protein PI126_g21817 [Phytophthora idaei]KAG3232968.1 hypothetical protein PI124_g21954 [Phytophthora idaei]